MTGAEELRLSSQGAWQTLTGGLDLCSGFRLTPGSGSKPDAKREGDRKRESTTVRLEIPSHLEPRDRDLLRPERRHSRKAQPREQDQLICSLRPCASAGKYRERRSCGLLCISVVIHVASILSILHGDGILNICGPVVVVRFLNARFGLCAPSLFGLVSMTGMADRADHRDFSSIPIQSANCELTFRRIPPDLRLAFPESERAKQLSPCKCSAATTG